MTLKELKQLKNDMQELAQESLLIGDMKAYKTYTDEFSKLHKIHKTYINNKLVK